MVKRISIPVCAALLSLLAGCSDVATPPASTTPGDPSSGSPNDAASAGSDAWTGPGAAEASSPSNDDASASGSEAGAEDDASAPPEDAAPADGGASASDASEPPIDGGSSDGGDGDGHGDGGACVLATAWASVASAGCAACQTANCCALVNVCAADPACVAVFNCQQTCYAYMWPDGAPIPKSGGVDDQCAEDCITAAPPATQMLFVPQDTCVNTTSCKKACSGG